MIKLLIASLPDRERVVVELWQGKMHLAEISNEDGTFRVELSTPSGGDPVVVTLDELEEALRQARQELSY